MMQTPSPRTVATWLRSIWIEPLHHDEDDFRQIIRAVAGRGLDANDLTARGIEVCRDHGIRLAGAPIDLGACGLTIDLMTSSSHGFDRLAQVEAELEVAGLRWVTPTTATGRRPAAVVDVGARRPVTTRDREELISVVLEHVDRVWGIHALHQLRARRREELLNDPEWA